MAIPRPQTLTQSRGYTASAQQQLYQRTVGQGYRHRYLEYKRQDWMFRVQLAQQELTEEYRSEVAYRESLTDSIRANQDAATQLRALSLQTSQDISGNQADVFNLMAQLQEQNDSQLQWRETEYRRIEEDLNVKDQSRGPLSQINRVISDDIINSDNASHAVTRLRASLLGTAGEGETGLAEIFNTISTIEGQGSISHRQFGRLVVGQIMALFDNEGYTSYEDDDGVSHRIHARDMREWVSGAMGLLDEDGEADGSHLLFADSATGEEGLTEVDDERARLRGVANNMSPIWLRHEGAAGAGTEAVELLGTLEDYGNALVQSQLNTTRLLTSVQQDIIDQEAALSEAEVPEVPTHEDILYRATDEHFDEPMTLREQLAMTSEGRRLRASLGNLDRMTPEERAVLVRATEAAHRANNGMPITDDQEVLERAQEIMEGMNAGTFDSNDLSTFSEEWARSRYQTRFESENPGAAITWNADTIANDSGELMTAVYGLINQGYTGVSEGMATPPRMRPETDYPVPFMGRDLSIDPDLGVEQPMLDDALIEEAFLSTFEDTP